MRFTDDKTYIYIYKYINIYDYASTDRKEAFTSTKVNGLFGEYLVTDIREYDFIRILLYFGIKMIHICRIY